MELPDALRTHFGFDQFRPGQESVIRALLAGESALALFPTGAGKSLCYQLPAVLLEGTALVISPLIALMKDQVDALRARGISAARLDSSLSAQETQRVNAELRDGTLKRSTFRSYMSPLRREVERLLEAGSQCGVSKTEGACQEIMKRREALWTFVQVEGVEPTNNAAERALRPGVQRRKISFGTQSEEGSRFVESMMTVVATLKQQQRNVLAYLTAAHEAALRGEAPPSLLPAGEMESQAAA